MQEATAKNCLCCGKLLRGRADKKFCDDGCRNSYNNRLKAPENNYVRNINNCLLKNRRILADMFPDTEEMVKVSRSKLVQHGFQFIYFTHQYTNKKGNIYFFCYEYGYLPLENELFLLVKRKPSN